jgi:rubrerythrin
MENLEKTKTIGTALEDEETDAVTGGVTPPLGGETKEFVCNVCHAKITYLNEPPKECPFCKKSESDMMTISRV